MNHGSIRYPTFAYPMVSDARRLFVTIFNFFDCHIIGATLSLLARKITKAPCEGTDGRLACVASKYARMQILSTPPRLGKTNRTLFYWTFLIALFDTKMF